MTGISLAVHFSLSSSFHCRCHFEIVFFLKWPVMWFPNAYALYNCIRYTDPQRLYLWCKAFYRFLAGGIVGSYIYEVWSTNNRYFQISWVTYVRYSHFLFPLCWYICLLNMCWQYQPFWIFSLFLTDKKVSRVFVCSSIFDYSIKWINETVLSFMKNWNWMWGGI